MTHYNLGCGSSHNMSLYYYLSNFNYITLLLLLYHIVSYVALISAVVSYIPIHIIVNFIKIYVKLIVLNPI